MARDTSNVLVAGDFDYHMDNNSNNDTRRILDRLKAGYLTQHVEFSTHVAGYNNDLLITRSYDAFLKKIIIIVQP